MTLSFSHARLSPGSIHKLMRQVEKLSQVDDLEEADGDPYGLVVGFIRAPSRRSDRTDDRPLSRSRWASATSSASPTSSRSSAAAGVRHRRRDHAAARPARHRRLDRLDGGAGASWRSPRRSPPSRSGWSPASTSTDGTAGASCSPPTCCARRSCSRSGSSGPPRWCRCCTSSASRKRAIATFLPPARGAVLPRIVPPRVSRRRRWPRHRWSSAASSAPASPACWSPPSRQGLIGFGIGVATFLVSFASCSSVPRGGPSAAGESGPRRHDERAPRLLTGLAIVRGSRLLARALLLSRNLDARPRHDQRPLRSAPRQ